MINMKMFDEAKVVTVIGEYEVVINKGSEAGVQDEHEFLIYSLGEDLQDPDTGESLGKLEIVRGKAKVKHVQTLVTTLASNEYEYTERKKIIRDTQGTPFAALAGLTGTTTEVIGPEKELLPFDDVTAGCFVRRIK